MARSYAAAVIDAILRRAEVEIHRGGSPYRFLAAAYDVATDKGVPHSEIEPNVNKIEDIYWKKINETKHEPVFAMNNMSLIGEAEPVAV